MRLHWGTSVEEVKLLSIDLFKGQPVMIGGRDFFSEEWQYWGQVKEETFPTWEAMENWVGVVMDTLAEKGYIDFRDETHIEIF